MAESAVVDVFLVRHAMPKLRPDASPATWVLSPEGRKAAVSLRVRLPSPATAVSSTEVKAVETLGLAIGEGSGSALATDAGFNEVGRPREPFDLDVLSRRRAWVEGRPDDRHEGWESPADAAVRFQRAVDGNRPASGPLVVVTHGMVMTAWLTTTGHVSPGEAAGDFWSGLRFPDVVRLTI